MFFSYSCIKWILISFDNKTELSFPAVLMQNFDINLSLIPFLMILAYGSRLFYVVHFTITRCHTYLLQSNIEIRLGWFHQKARTPIKKSFLSTNNFIKNPLFTCIQHITIIFLEKFRLHSTIRMIILKSEKRQHLFTSILNNPSHQPHSVQHQPHKLNPSQYYTQSDFFS